MEGNQSFCDVGCSYTGVLCTAVEVSASNRAVEARASRRLRGSELDRAVMFQDPEAIMRAQRQVGAPPLIHNAWYLDQRASWLHCTQSIAGVWL